MLVLPDAARVVLGSRNNGISLVIKGAREYFIFVAVERLDLVAGVGAPHLASFVAARSDNLVTLGIKLNLTDFVVMSLQKCNTCTRKHIVDAR